MSGADRMPQVGFPLMSLDYPYYEELRRRNHHAARWWLIGDRLYYLGVLPAFLAIALAVAGLLAGILGRGWSVLVASPFVFVGSVLVAIVGSVCKRRAYALGERDGISAVEVFRRSGNELPSRPWNEGP